VDTSASTTVVARDFLAPDAPIEPATMVERSASGVRTLEAGMTGATGSVGGLLGQAGLEDLTLGAISFGGATVRVLDELPSFAGRRIVGILGLDLLRRGGRVSLRWPREGQAGELELGASGTTQEGPGMRLPVSVVSGIPFVRGELSGQAVRFAVDTGSRFVFVGQASAGRLGLELDPEQGISFRGLGPDTGSAPRVLGAELSVGGRTHEGLPMHAADLPVFARLARGCDVGVLGLPFLRSFESFALDLEAGELTLAP
jgi:hypothetical protein